MEKIITRAEAYLMSQKKIQEQPREAKGKGAFKDKDGEFNAFLDLSEVLKIVVPCLNEYGFTLIQGTEVRSDNRMYLFTRVEYCPTKEIIELSSFPYGMAGVAATMQALGSEETYLRRRQLCTVFCLYGEKDDDAQKATDEASSQSVPHSALTKSIDKISKEQEKIIREMTKDKPEIRESIYEYYGIKVLGDLPQKAFEPIVKRLQEKESA